LYSLTILSGSKNLGWCRILWARRHACKTKEKFTGFGWWAQTKKHLGKSRHRWVDNVKMALTLTESDGINWIHLAQEVKKWMALVKILRPPGVIKWILWPGVHLLASQDRLCSMQSVILTIPKKYIYKQGVPGGMWNTSGECSLS